MRRPLPPVHWLHAFEATARHMSFTRAAHELRVTQSAVSQRIKLLEHHLGQPLFVRHARSLDLTEAGRAYVPAVQEAFERLTTGTAEVFGPRRDEPLTVRVTPGFAIFWLNARLPRFIARHPEVTLRLSTAIWPPDFASDGADLDIRYGRGDWDGVVTQRLTWERVFPICAPDIASRLRQPSDLAGETLLHTVGFELGWPHWLREAKVPEVAERAHALLCDTLVVVVDLAYRGAGVALTRSSFAVNALRAGQLEAPFDLSLPTGEAFHLVRPARRRLRPEAEAFWTWLSEEAENEFAQQ